MRSGRRGNNTPGASNVAVNAAAMRSSGSTVSGVSQDVPHEFEPFALGIHLRPLLRAPSPW